MEPVDVAIVGCGAAGLTAAIWAARSAPGRRIVGFDGARTLGAKILVAGGGRCNVTHEQVDERDYAGSSPKAIAKVLRQFPVDATIAWFRELGVELVREPTGKLFPTTNRARTVLDALLRAAHQAGAALRFPARVEHIVPSADGFVVAGPWGQVTARRVVLAAGGRALPKSGSDGSGLTLAHDLGHTITPVFPALVPLTLPPTHPLCALSGVAAPAKVEVRSSSGRRLFATTGAVLLTHFGLSGPAILDVSRHLLAARRVDPTARLILGFLPELDRETLDQLLLGLARRSVGGWLSTLVPERLADTLCALAEVDPHTTGLQLRREQRRSLLQILTELEIPVTGDRGFEKAEAMAGGVSLAEVQLDTMASRRCSGLFLSGEILDVDGRIGGFNFQWAWASGRSAGLGAARAL